MKCWFFRSISMVFWNTNEYSKYNRNAFWVEKQKVQMHKGILRNWKDKSNLVLSLVHKIGKENETRFYQVKDKKRSGMFQKESFPGIFWGCVKQSRKVAKLRWLSLNSVFLFLSTKWRDFEDFETLGFSFVSKFFSRSNHQTWKGQNRFFTGKGKNEKKTWFTANLRK